MEHLNTCSHSPNLFEGMFGYGGEVMDFEGGEY